jgi:hypothetical protein
MDGEERERERMWKTRWPGEQIRKGRMRRETGEREWWKSEQWLGARKSRGRTMKGFEKEIHTVKKREAERRKEKRREGHKGEGEYSGEGRRRKRQGWNMEQRGKIVKNKT